MSYDASSGVDNMHPLMEKQPTKKNTRPPFFSIQCSCFHVPGYNMLRSAHHASARNLQRDQQRNPAEKERFYFIYFPQKL